MVNGFELKYELSAGLGGTGDAGDRESLCMFDRNRGSTWDSPFVSHLIDCRPGAADLVCYTTSSSLNEQVEARILEGLALAPKFSASPSGG